MRSLAIVLIPFIFACKARQTTADLASSETSAPCTTGFEPTCTAEQLTTLIGAATTAFVDKSDAVADSVGVVSYVSEQDGIALGLADTEGDINTLRGKLAELRTESSIADVAAAQANVGELTALVDRIEALVSRLAEVKRATGATPDAAVSAQITVLERQVTVLLQRVRAARTAAVTAQTYEMALWVKPQVSFATAQTRLASQAGVSAVAGDRRKGYLTFKVLSANTTATLQAMRSYYDDSFYRTTFVEKGFDRWTTWRITHSSRCEFASAWIALSALCLGLDRYGGVTTGANILPDAQRACKVAQSDPHLTLRTMPHIENPTNEVFAKISHNRCGHDWEYPLH